jgi:nitrilase
MARVAVVQAGSQYGDVGATLVRLERLAARAAREGAELIVFPEAFLGGYPMGPAAPSAGRAADSGSAQQDAGEVQGHEEFRPHEDASVELDGPELDVVADVAAGTGASLVVGLVELDRGTLYSTAAFVEPGRGVTRIHRKLHLTPAERAIWGGGDGSTIAAVDTPAGRAGMALGGESYLPMLRQAMYAQQVDLYCAPTVDDGEGWQHTARHIALEGRTFVLSACQYTRREDYPDDHAGFGDATLSGAVLRGGSVIVDPWGEVLAGPVHDREDVLFADIDLDVRARARLDRDVAGRDARPDVFRLVVDDRPKPVVVRRSEGSKAQPRTGGAARGATSQVDAGAARRGASARRTDVAGRRIAEARRRASTEQATEPTPRRSL